MDSNHLPRRYQHRALPVELAAPREWQGRKDSNPRPSVLETDALTRLSYAPIGRSQILPSQYDRSMAAFLANVGVNAGHAARSPLHEDRTFQLVPIPEKLPWRPPMLRFADLAGTVPSSWRERAAHLDPDLTATVPTYGDNCRLAGRAYALRRAQPDDVIVFMA